ncbi:MAG: 23S rRNA (guanosine(2251)-2'-O)-methyltransferase RlmB [Candidatus Omnitrophica bacterium]|nr:23S rRNA (guanosine(2251)-2'-O)-methyltransferase RlmB [Candidatus Omnitrophota bacterium]
MYLYGKNSVLQRLKANPKSIKKLYLQDDLFLPEIERLIRLNKIEFRRLPKPALYKVKKADNLQGLVAAVDAFSYTDFGELLDFSGKEKPSFIFLDRVFDPQNLGSIIRTAACTGGFNLVIPKHRACQITDTVLHVASGGENYLKISSVVNLRNAVLEAKKAGYWIYGAVLEKAQRLDKAKLSFPLGLVLGSEGKGLRYGLDKHLDFRVSIPMQGEPLSFNVTTACAIFCYEILKQRLF